MFSKKRTKEEKHHRLTELFDKFYPLIITVAERYLEPDIAKDVAQSSFVKLYRTYDMFAPEKKIKDWLLMITITGAQDKANQNQSGDIENH